MKGSKLEKKLNDRTLSIMKEMQKDIEEIIKYHFFLGYLLKKPDVSTHQKIDKNE